MTTDNLKSQLDKATNYFEKGDFHKALSHFESLKKQQNNFLIHWYLGHTYFKLHKYTKALQEIQKSIKLKSKDSLNLNFLGKIYIETNQYDKALEVFEEALLFDNNNQTVLSNLANINLYLGNVKKSEKYFNILLKKNSLNFAHIYQLIKIDNKYLQKELINEINKKNYFDFHNSIYSKLILALQNKLDKNYNFEINNLIEAHKIFLKSTKKPTNQQYNYYSNLLPQFIERIPKMQIKDQSDLNPIFIMGLPRSGTSLVEKIIISGKNPIQYLGESDVIDKVFFAEKIIKDYESEDLLTDFNFSDDHFLLLKEKILNQYNDQGLKNNSIVFTDKSISNFLYLEIIKILFPKAKFVYCYRNPLANILGILRTFLPNVYWSHSLEKTFSMFNLYFNKLNMLKNNKFYNIHIVNLEELTQNPEMVSKKLYNYLNLDWDKDCIKKNNKNAIIKTASNLQVRKEITKHDLGYTSNYLKILNDLGFKDKWLTQSI